MEEGWKFPTKQEAKGMHPAELREEISMAEEGVRMLEEVLEDREANP